MHDILYIITDLNNNFIASHECEGGEAAMTWARQYCITNNITAPIRVFVEICGSPYTPERH